MTVKSQNSIKTKVHFAPSYTLMIKQLKEREQEVGEMQNKCFQLESYKQRISDSLKKEAEFIEFEEV